MAPDTTDKNDLGRRDASVRRKFRGIRMNKMHCILQITCRNFAYTGGDRLAIQLNQSGGHVGSAPVCAEHADDIPAIACAHAEDAQRARRCGIETVGQMLLHCRKSLLITRLVIGFVKPMTPCA